MIFSYAQEGIITGSCYYLYFESAEKAKCPTNRNIINLIHYLQKGEINFKKEIT